MELKLFAIEKPEPVNFILGQSHFIKTVEDLYEVLITSAPGLKFGLAFSEASGACLIRAEGSDEEMKALAIRNAERLACGHTFLVFLKDCFPINVLNAIKGCQEVCRIFCATANPLQVIVAESEQGRGILGVIDGAPPKGVEDEQGRAWRREFLRKIGYKR